MADLVLSFKLKPSMRWSDGTFYIEGPDIRAIGNDFEITYDDIRLDVDGQPYDGSAESWAGHKYTVDEIFEQVLSSYLRQDGAYTEFTQAWDIFSEIEDLKVYKNGMLIKFPVYDWSGISMFSLAYATPEHRYYSCDDQVLMLDENNEVITDMEMFYMEALMEDITNVFLGDTTCLYEGYDVKEMIEEAGGEAAWLEEYT